MKILKRIVFRNLFFSLPSFSEYSLDSGGYGESGVDTYGTPFKRGVKRKRKRNKLRVIEYLFTFSRKKRSISSRGVEN